eukprot:gene5842-7271_t
MFNSGSRLIKNGKYCNNLNNLFKKFYISTNTTTPSSTQSKSSEFDILINQEDGDSNENGFKPSQYFYDLERLPVDQFKDRMYSIGEEAKIKTYDQVYNRLSFSDRVRISLRAGNGGDGGVSFYRAKYVPEGPPDGGHGGDGSSIIIKSDYMENNLSHLSKTYVGTNGGKGMGRRRSGKSGNDIVLHVPPGTIVRELELTDDNDEDYEFQYLRNRQSEREDEDVDEGPVLISRKDPRYNPKSVEFDPELYIKSLNTPVIDGEIKDKHHIGMVEDEQLKKNLKWKVKETILDMDTPGQEYLICQGGKGGKGNMGTATGANRSPDYAQPGTKGVQREIELELKILADIGLVGYPNAGKSTLLAAISNAMPKICMYPFTTIRPYVGVVDFLKLKEEYQLENNKLSNLSKRKRNPTPTVDPILTASVADLPGILEGAHLNIGLGLDFLRHIERTKALCFVIDMGNEGSPVFWDGKPVQFVPDRYKNIIHDNDALQDVLRDIRTRGREGYNRSPWQDFVNLLEELESYKPGIINKPTLIVANKMDHEFAGDHLEEFKKAVGHLIRPDTKIIPVSANSKQNIDQVKREMRNIILKLN